jgi:hypothetical protein
MCGRTAKLSKPVRNGIVSCEAMLMLMLMRTQMQMIVPMLMSKRTTRALQVPRCDDVDSSRSCEQGSSYDAKNQRYTLAVGVLGIP